MKRVIITIAVAGTIATGIVACNRGPGGPSLVASGTVEATDAQLGFQVTGRINDIVVREGERVRAGTALAHLDTVETAARRNAAMAGAAAAAAQLDELEHGARREEVAQARAARDAAQQKLAEAERGFDRTNSLYRDGAISREAFDNAGTALDVAKAQFTQADQQFRLVSGGPRAERIAAARAQLDQANAAVAQITAAIRNMTIHAPFDGIVTVRSREPGETVSPGSSVLTLLNPNDRWVRIYVPEDRLGAVRLGAPAVITTDTYRRKTYRGDVVYIASEAEFTPKTVQTKEERVKLVYAVKIGIQDDDAMELKPGMPADVRLDLNRP
jgi:HlyD family secretion protein